VSFPFNALLILVIDVFNSLTLNNVSSL